VSKPLAHQPDSASEKIERIAADKLSPRVRNARTHSEKQIRQIAASIQRFGFTNPILIDDNNQIIAGHGRLAAAKLLAIPEVPTIRLSHLSAAEIRACMLADNKLATNAGWDREILTTELQTLIDLDFDIELIGFDTIELDVLFDESGRSSKCNDEQIFDPARPTVSRRGDIWTCGLHRIACDDALDGSTYARLMGDERAEMVFADPPYNLKIIGHVSGLGKVRHREFAMASGEMSIDEFTAFLKKAFSQIAAYSNDGAINFIFMDWRHLLEILTAGYAVYSELKNVVVWNKNNGGMGSFYRSKHELILVWKHGTSPHINNFELGQNGRYRTNVWDYSGVNVGSARHDEDSVHPTPKPVDLVADAIRDVSHRKGIVLDPFAGSGVAVIACEHTGRIARAIEIDPQYVDVAVQRWQRESGQTATLHGRTFDAVAAERLKEINHG
jgi:DNA modification methylase